MLEIKNLCFEVKENSRGKEIIRGINLDVKENRVVVVTGPNGGGKSTLAKLIAGVEQPTDGTILFDQEDITHLSITERARRGISYAMQQPVRFKGLEVYDLLKTASGKKITVGKACEYLSQVGLCARYYIHRDVNSSLSGGELKRIEIASVLARGSRLTIFDEPEAGIDLWSFQNLIHVFERMRASISDSSILIISHQERILEIADEIIVVADGQIKNRGSKEDILPALIGTSNAMPPCTRLEERGS